NPQDHIRGNVSPLSGGAFDTQSARYAAEAETERKRYADQLARLNEAKNLELLTKQQYHTLEQEMEREHQARMQQIAMAGVTTTLNNAESLFGSLASLYKQAEGEQSRAYKSMFALSKAFSIANAGLNFALALSQALADPTAMTLPQKMANYAAVAATGGALLSQIGSAAFSGRQNGGPVSPGSMYRINENGAPEVFNAANGRQYMLPNQRGEVVSNKDATGGASVKVDIHNHASNARVTATPVQTDNGQLIRVLIEDLDNNGPASQTLQSKFGLGYLGR